MINKLMNINILNTFVCSSYSSKSGVRKEMASKKEYQHLGRSFTSHLFFLIFA